jgi:hypothetical protein
MIVEGAIKNEPPRDTLGTQDTGRRQTKQITEN